MEGHPESDLQSSAQARCGSTIADAYLLERLLGIGGMGAVYAASAMNGSQVAVKVLHRFVSQVPGTRERFRDEALVARRIQHPGVVRIYDDGVSREGDLYLVMELLHGQAIDERMMNAGGALPMAEVLPIAASALETVHAAHEAGVIHRDLKPENLFLTTSRTLKVLDFGIAKLSGPDRLVKRTRTGVVMGTPAFMAPEQARSTLGEVDRRTDVWAMGAVMFTALSGRPVHPGEDVGEVLAAAAMRPAQSLARVVQAPLPLVRVVDRALSFDKSERFESAAAMREAIREAIVEIREGARPGPVSAPVASSPQDATAHLQSLVENDAGAGDGHDPFAVPPPSDEDRAVLVEHFTLLERMLLGAQQYGMGHPETEKRLALAVSYAVEAIQRTERPLAWNITPYSFVAAGLTLWEPRSPYERIPYQLFADGIRVIVLLPGITALELDGFIRMIMRDRFREMAPEDDFVTLLWESDFDHIAHQAIDSFGDGDLTRRSRFENDVRDVEQIGRTPPGVIAQCWLQRGAETSGSPTPQAHGARIRRILDGTGAIDAGAIASAESMLSGAHRSPMPDRALQLSEDMVRVLSAKLDGDAAQVEPKFVRAIGLAWVEARGTGALDAVAARIRSAIDASALVRPDAALATLGALASVVAQKQPDFMPAIVSDGALTAVLAAPNAAAHAEAIRRLLGFLDASSAPRIVDIALGIEDGPIKEAMLGYLARPDLDCASRLVDQIAAADEERALAILRLLIRLAAKPAIARATTSPHAVVRIEAIGHLEGPSSEKLRLELKALLEADDPGQRIAALATIERNAVRVAGPTLVLRIRGPKFDALPPDEKAMALRTLATLAPRRAEEVCIELVANAGLVPLEAREQTRIAAAELLGEIATSPAAREALQAAASSRWRSGEKLRTLAKNAHERLSLAPPPPSKGKP